MEERKYREMPRNAAISITRVLRKEVRPHEKSQINGISLVNVPSPFSNQMQLNTSILYWSDRMYNPLTW